MIRRVILLELRIYRNLARWIARRPDIQGEPFGYSRLVTPVLWLWIFGSAAETVAVHFIVPWEVPRLIADVVGVWGLLWMLGFLAGMRVYPHLVTPEALRIRHGGNHDVTVPWDAVESITHRPRSLESSIKTRREKDGEVFIAVNNEVNIRVVRTDGTAISFYADEPKKLIAARTAYVP